MYFYLLLLRILHIVGGVMWAGTAFLMTFYIFPAAIKSGPDGGKMMQAITGTNRFPQMITVVASVVVVTGFLLMWQLSSGLVPEWFSTRYGMALSLGGGASFIAYLQVLLINRPGVIRMQAISSAAAARGGAPSDAERNEMMKIRDRMVLSTRWIAFLLFLAVITMAGARYL